MLAVLLPCFLAPVFLQAAVDLRIKEDIHREEIACKEKPKSSQVKPDLPDAWAIIRAPGRWNKVAVNGSNNDYKAFEPHSHIDQYRHEEGKGYISSEFP